MDGLHDLQIPDHPDLLKPAIDLVEKRAPQWGNDIYKGIKDLPSLAPATPTLHEIPRFAELEHSIERFFGGDGAPEAATNGTPEAPKPETHFDPSNFDKLGPDVAAFLKAADAQSLDINGDTVRIKLANGYEQSGNGSKIKFDTDISFKVSKGDSGELRMTDISGIKAEVGGPLGTTLDVGIKEIIMREQDGKAFAEVKADTPIGEKTQTAEVPHDIYALAENLVEHQSG